ncbi:hypothetical protein [Streptosporangium carneum]|uniref:Uncharacterized protein n=1 Tax=Streptosporangium carneum TaxID=47481 RepID=A0A9W6MAI2_9ACTN|nr:hypothetical protein [Streptosporangium carneum]GLK06688.1 hypothetical protein GCM10017600_00930 [Streptosporangium carneum]
MSYEEKGKWIYLLVILGTYGAYVAVILSRTRGVPLAEVAYVSPMLWSIGVSIVLSIVGRIVVEIAKPSESYKIDVRDRDINRFGEYVGGTVLGVAMVVPFGLVMLETDYFWIANAIYAAFVVSALTSTCLKLVAYRRGL